MIHTREGEKRRKEEKKVKERKTERRKRRVALASMAIRVSFLFILSVSSFYLSLSPFQN
jgi:hypothetical protein